MRAKTLLAMSAAILVTVIASAPAFAGPSQPVPEPVSLSLLAGGIAAIAVIKRVNRR